MSFLFVTCQAGAEVPLKAEIARRYRGFRFAFSRPGFVTFKIPDDIRRDRQFDLKSVFARTWGFSIDKVSGTDGHELARSVWSVLTERYPSETLAEFRNIHVWERDRYLPGDNDFEPGVSPLAEEVAELLLETAPESQREPGLQLNEIAAPEDRVLDVVLVEPGEWWFGWHRAGSIQSTWPGGVPFIDVPDEIVSRTYLKMAEALQWSELPLEKGDACVEIGSAPGGSCQALLERGMTVTGVDPADMHESLLANPYFTHLRARAKNLKRRMFSDFRWLMSDASAVPNYTLDSVEAIIEHKSSKVDGLLLTLKLTDWNAAEHIPDFTKRVRSWGYAYVRARQLAHNRREFCLAASGRIPGKQGGKAG